MFYCLLATAFAQAAITLRFAAASTSFGVDYSLGIQSICRHGEKSVDRLLPLPRDFGTICLRDVRFDSLRAAAQYVFPLRPLYEISEKTPTQKAVVIPDIPFDVHRLCSPPRWRGCEIVFIVLTIVYGTFFSTVWLLDFDDEPFVAQDSWAFLVIIYSARNRGVMRAHGMPSLLDNIVRDATIYFLVLFTVHLLVVFFELLAPVSDHWIDSYPSVH